ncbi:MAG: transglycosylase SLT domain-containing protein [Propioniciclava sp.]
MLSATALAVVTAGTAVGFSQSGRTLEYNGIVVSADALAEAHEDGVSRGGDRTAVEEAAAARSARLNDQNDAITARETEVLLQNRNEEQAALTKTLAKEGKRLLAEAERQAIIAKHGYDPEVTEPREIARQMMENKFGWGAAEFTCYDNIIMRESLWNPTADNPTSSAYGIPQALPGNRMASEGDDWRTNPATQIRWGLKYVKERYGTPCSAWSFKAAHGWY